MGAAKKDGLNSCTALTTSFLLTSICSRTYLTAKSQLCKYLLWGFLVVAIFLFSIVSCLTDSCIEPAIP